MVVLDGMVIRLGFRSGVDGVIPVDLAVLVVSEVDRTARLGLEVGGQPTGEES
jgi:hypothetical protein